MRDPVCVLIYRDPLDNAESLFENTKKSQQSNQTLPMTVERWLQAWEEGAKCLYLHPWETVDCDKLYPHNIQQLLYDLLWREQAPQI